MQSGEGRIPGQWGPKELYEWMAEDTIESIREIHRDSSFFQGLRERHFDKWEIVELCREIIFENAKYLKRLTQDVEYYREQAKEFS